MKESSVILSCRGLSVGYFKKTVLAEMDFDFPLGSMTVLIGANGSGKSTLLRTLAGQQRPLSGTIVLDGKPLAGYTKSQLAKARAIVSTVREGGGGLTVEETVAIGRYAFTGWSGTMSADDKRIVDESIEAVGVGGFKGRYLANLSDGERQKVMVARALAQQTPLIILDEPTAFLDVAARIEIMRLLRNLADRGNTIILSTHDIAPAVSQADMLLVVDADMHTAVLEQKEKIIEEGLLNNVFAKSGLHFDVFASDFR